VRNAKDAVMRKLSRTENQYEKIQNNIYHLRIMAQPVHTVNTFIIGRGNFSLGLGIAP